MVYLIIIMELGNIQNNCIFFFRQNLLFINSMIFMDGDNMKKIIVMFVFMVLTYNVKAVTLQEIINDTPDGGIIKLERDYNESISLDKNLIIDTNGYSISGSIINNDISSFSYDKCLIDSSGINMNVSEDILEYSDLSEDSIISLNNYLGYDGIVSILDINIEVICGDYKIGNISNMSNAIMYKYVIPLSFLNIDGINRKFNVIKLSNNIDEIENYYDAEAGTISFEINSEGIYIITYSDTFLYSQIKDEGNLYSLFGMLVPFIYFLFKKLY